MRSLKCVGTSLRAGAFAVAIALLVVVSSAGAQSSGPPDAVPDMAIDAATRARVLKTAEEKLVRYHYSEAIGRAAAAKLHERASRGEFDRMTSAQAFAAALTNALRADANDRHIRVLFEPNPVPEDRDERVPPPSAAEKRKIDRQTAWTTFAWRNVDRLDGNLGYVRLDGFMDFTAIHQRIAAAAMNFLHDTDGLIIDLRHNGGGVPEPVAGIASYLLPRTRKPKLLFGIDTRWNGRSERYYYGGRLRGERYLGKNVYVLTSDRTFSAAEQFAYVLKHIGRVTVIGERTGGGAHPSLFRKLDTHFALVVPDGQTVNPQTPGKDWEGTGISPDVRTNDVHALARAKLLALTKILAVKQRDRETPEFQILEIRKAIEQARAELKRR